MSDSEQSIQDFLSPPRLSPHTNTVGGSSFGDSFYTPESLVITERKKRKHNNSRSIIRKKIEEKELTPLRAHRRGGDTTQIIKRRYKRALASTPNESTKIIIRPGVKEQKINKYKTKTRQLGTMIEHLADEDKRIREKITKKSKKLDKTAWKAAKQLSTYDLLGMTSEDIKEKIKTRKKFRAPKQTEVHKVKGVKRRRKVMSRS